MKKKKETGVDMNKKRITLLCGKSGSGKDYLVDALGLDVIVTHTTRPKRDYEINGVHKHFHTEKIDYDLIKNDPHTVAHTKRGNYIYWATTEDLLSGDCYVIDFPGIKAIAKNKTAMENFDFVVTYVDCCEQKRVYNMKQRGESIDNIQDRLEIDDRDFEGIEKVADYIIKK